MDALFVYKPLVSIIINNYNYGCFIGSAIDSALAQTYPCTEIIVVDDGSTDNSQEVILSYGNRIIPVLKENNGQASAFNAGFIVSNGSIICVLDSDDTFIAEKVAEVVEVFRCYKDIGWCFHPLRMVDTNTNKFIKIDPPSSFSGEIDFRASIKRGRMPLFAPATSGLCFSRLLLEQLLPVPEAEDTAIFDRYLKFAALGLSKGVFLNKDLVVQGIHSNNAFSIGSGGYNSDKQRKESRTLILTAYWLRLRFPVLARFANKIFGIGIGNYWRNGGIDTKYKKVVKEYLSTLTALERLETSLRAYYHYSHLFAKVRRFRLACIQKSAICSDLE